MPGASVIPELGYADVGKAVEWLCGAFGFRVRLRIANHRAQLHVGNGAVVVHDGGPDGQSSVMVRVEDVDAHCARARAFGAEILREPESFPYGERQYSATDLAGHRWHFSQSIADSDPADWGGTLVER